MATNADVEEETEVSTDVVDDLRKAKEESEPNSITEELTPSEEESTKDEESPAEEESKDEPEATLTTEPQEPEHDLAWYEKAYGESTAEALRLKKENDELKKVSTPPVIDTPSVTTDDVTLTPEQLYIKQKQDEETAEAFGKVQEDYPQVKDKAEYDRFVAMAQTVGKNIVDAEKRLPPPKEVYAKTVVLLGWTADDKAEKLGAALKDGAASPRVSSGSSQPTTSKVTDAMIAANRKMYPGKSDAEIREELEPYIQ